MTGIKKYPLVFILIITIPCIVASQNNYVGVGQYIKNILPMRERVQNMELWWKWKRKHVLPDVMREQSVDMWIIRNNEADLYYNNEGPVFTSLLSANFEGMTLPSKYASPGSQRIPSFLLFFDSGNEIQYYEPRDYEHVGSLAKTLNPKRIAISSVDNKLMLRSLGKNIPNALLIHGL